MTASLMVRTGISVAMTGCMVALMIIQATGGLAHEWVAAALLVLVVAHNVAHRRWHRNLRKGRWASTRVAGGTVTLLALVCLLGAMVTGMLMSRHLFTFLPFEISTTLAQRLHLLLSHWAFVFVAAHVGVSWRSVQGTARRAARGRIPQPLVVALARGSAAALVLCGLYAFGRHQFGANMLLLNEYTYRDHARPASLLTLDYVGLLALWATLTFYGLRLLPKPARRSQAHAGR